MDPRLFNAIVVVVGVPATLIGYILLIEWLLRLLPSRAQPRIRPWLWLLPALAFLGVFLVYPTIQTIIRSLQDKFGKNFIGLDNYAWFFGNPQEISTLFNTLLWVVLLPIMTVGVGLLIAVIVDRVKYESIAKSVIFMPLAISATAAGVIWFFMYLWQPPGQAQVGTLNALIGVVGAGPVDFRQTTDLRLNTIMLVGVMAWMWTGFAMVIISAAYKGISPELMEASRVDGATEWQVFRNIVWPLLVPTIAVITTTMIITALKAFDIVYVMSGGNFDTSVIALEMWRQVGFGQLGRSAAVAVILLLAIIPVMLFNIRNFRAQEAIR
ncbi:MAG TPA: sugar ABC transporter permease [Candidatus Limnocylindrales bacterium]|nr:sugar ABC transporter permease [Candidatus Limnocylindrales bacterium]